MNSESIYAEFIPWGYYLIRGTVQGVPEFSGCQGQCKDNAVLPDYDSMPGVNQAFQPETFAEKWNVAGESALKIFERNSELFERKRLTFFNSRYMNISDVRKLKKDFFHGRSDVSVFGVGFVNPELTKTPEFRKLSPFAPGGEFLGFDLYGFYFYENKPDFSKLDCSMGCPFRHCDMENRVPAELNIPLNSHGLYFDAESVERVASHVHENKLGEPEFYVPFGIIRYKEDK